MNLFTRIATISFAVLLTPITAADLAESVERRVEAVMPEVVSWRRDLHEHPELGNREFRTAGIIAEHLRGLGMEVRTEVAHTGVIGVLKGGDGPVVALRADMDGLPVTELVDLPFASKARGEKKAPPMEQSAAPNLCCRKAPLMTCFPMRSLAYMSSPTLQVLLQLAPAASWRPQTAIKSQSPVSKLTALCPGPALIPLLQPVKSFSGYKPSFLGS